jgi:hypothetical protein
MSTFLADGIGGETGDSLCLEIGYIGISAVWYVSSESGTDASGYGRNREAPFATIAYAVGAVTEFDTIVVLSDHEETTTSVLTIDKSVLIVGEGSNGGNPTAVWGTDATGTDAIVDVSADDVEIRNIKFTAPEQAMTAHRILWGGDDGKLRGCYFECDENDEDSVVLVEGDHFLAESTTWISVGTSLATRPYQALSTDASGLTVFRMIGCVVSGGASGWEANTGAVYLAQGSGLNVRIEAQSLLLGADITVTSGCTGFVSVPTATGGGQVRNI